MIRVFRVFALYSGVVGVIILVSTVSVAMRRVHLGFIDTRPISYLGLYAQTKHLFKVGLITSAILYMIFGTYVRRYFSIRPVFLFYLIFGQLCQIIVAVVPDKTGSPLRIVHTVAGFALAVSLPFLIRELANNRRNKPHHKLFLVLSRVEQATFVIGIGLFIFVNGIAPLGEVLPTTGFDLWVIVITVIISQARPKSSKKLKSAYGSSKY